MATHTVKTTYSLDLETMRALDELTRRWNVSRSEALRRAIKASALQDALTPIQALERAQRSLGLTRREAARWATEVCWEREARSRKREARGR